MEPRPACSWDMSSSGADGSVEAEGDIDPELVLEDPARDS